MAGMRTVFCTGLLAFPRTQPTMRTLFTQATWKAAKQSRRPFSSRLILNSRPLRSPITQTRRSSSSHHHNSPQRPLGSSASSLIIGSVIASCIGLYGYNQHLVTTASTTNSRQAYHALQTLRQNFRLSLHNLSEGRYWTLLTHSLLHENPTHLFCDMFALWGFGRYIVAWYGLPHFAVLWVGSALLGGVAQLGFFEALGPPRDVQEACGASGAIFGMLAALACAAPRMPIALMFFLPMSLRTGMLLSAVGSVGAVTYGWVPWMGHMDHLGGMAFGLLWWLVALRRGSVSRLY